MKKYTKVETIEEFLARGGKIQVIPAQSSDVEENKRKVKSTSKQQLALTDLGEGELLYGEKIKKTRKAKKKIVEIPKEQVNLLPDSLKHLANKESNEEK